MGFFTGFVSLLWHSLSDRAKRRRGMSFEGVERPTCETGDPIPVVFGTVDIKAPNLTWFGNSRSIPRYWNDQLVSRDYFVSMHLTLCCGSADKLIKVRVDDKTAYQSALSGSTATDTEIYIDKEQLFNGDGMGGGGVQGTLRLEQGLPDQTQNEYMASHIEQDIPAYRGITAAVLEDMYVGKENQLKKWDFTIQRITIRTDGAEQWYPEKVMIPTISTTAEITVLEYDDDWRYLTGSAYGEYPSLTNDANFDTFGTDEPGPYGVITTSTPTYPVATPWLRGNGIWLRKTIEVDGVHAIKFTGEILQYCAIYLKEMDAKTIIWPKGEIDDNTDFYDFEFVLTPDKMQAGSITLYVWCGDRRSHIGTPIERYFYIEAEKIPIQTMNPIHAIRECLTDTDWGLGYYEGDIDDVSFRVAADTVFDENLGICIKWERSNTVEDFINDLLRYVDAELYVDRITGMYTIKLIRDDYDEGSLYELDESNIKSVSGYKRVAFGELINSIVVQYYNMKIQNENSISIKDNGLIQSQGGLIQKSVDYTGFVTVKSATLAGRRDLKSLSSPLMTATITAYKEAELLNQGDVFKWTWPDYDADEIVMRVNKIRLGDGDNREVVITATQDEFDLPEVSTEIDEPIDPPDVPVGVGDIDLYMTWELPYYEANKALGRAEFANRIESDYSSGWFGAAAGTSDGNVDYTLYTNPDDAGYTNVDNFDFVPTARIAADVDYMDTILTIDEFTGFENVKAGMMMYMIPQDEIMLIVSVDSATQLTVERAMLDTLPQEHVIGQHLLVYDFNMALDPQYYQGYCEGEGSGPTGVDVDSKFRANGFSDVQPTWMAVEGDHVFMRQRQRRPYPPGNLKINSSYFPESITGALVLTWEDRNRLDLDNLVDFTATGVTSESGVKYIVTIYDSSAVEISSEQVDGTYYVYDFRSGTDPGDSFYLRVQSVVYSDTERRVYSYYSYYLHIERDDYGIVLKDTFGNSRVIKDTFGSANIIKDTFS